MDKKTLIAFALIGFILILTQTKLYKSRVMPKKADQIEFVKTKKDSVKKNESIKNQPVTVVNTTQKVDEKVVAPIINQKEKEILSKIKGDKIEEKEIRISSDIFEAVLSNKGGGLLSWKLRKYADVDSQLVELIPRVKYGLPTIGFEIDGDSVFFNQQNYIQKTESFVSSNNVILDDKNKSFSIRYILEFRDGKKIEKDFTFYAHRYDLDLSVKLSGFENISTDKSYQLVWNASLLPTEMRIKDDLGYYKIYAYLGEDLQDFNVSEKEKTWKTEKVTGSVNWVAMRTKYFLSAISPLSEKGRSLSYRAIGFFYAPNQRFKHYEYTINMPLGNSRITQNQYKIYLGPLEYKQLKKLNLGLDKLIMRSGGYEKIFRPFSIIILISFKFIHKFIPNYGLVIILFSILIKLILYPLTHKSYISMKKMQLIQPKMTELKEKYKKDSQQLNKHMMGLYKDYGVNPMGGCLPMLLQMPLLIGLFIVFRSTIDLRGADFFWWITDLSKPDSIFTLPFTLPLYGQNVGVLPIVMGITMFLQQKSTMQDPRQKMMAYFMPFFFVFLFNSFPSGLNLYYTLFNVWTIIQQKMIKTEDMELKPVQKKPDKRKRGKR